MSSAESGAALARRALDSLLAMKAGKEGEAEQLRALLVLYSQMVAEVGSRLIKRFRKARPSKRRDREKGGHPRTHALEWRA